MANDVLKKTKRRLDELVKLSKRARKFYRKGRLWEADEALGALLEQTTAAYDMFFQQLVDEGELDLEDDDKVH